jgi:stalled ribosome alternative rescue factor ArfA
MKKEKIDKRMFKKEGEELQMFLHFKKRGCRVENKKGKGSYSRKRKHKNQEE